MKTENSTYTPDEMLVVAMSREIKDRDVIGLGLATPMATVAVFLAREMHAHGATIILSGAVQPKTHNVALSMIDPGRLASISFGFVPHTETMDMAERGVYSLQFLRPAQIDGEANMNTSLIGTLQKPKLRLPGGLATGDVPFLMPRLILYQPNHERRSFPPRVDYKTGIGQPQRGRWPRQMNNIASKPMKVVTNLCVVVFDTDAGGFAVESLHPGVSIETVKERTGFDLIWPDSIRETEPPSRDEIALLRGTIDPYAVRRLERKEHRHEVLRRLKTLQKEIAPWSEQEGTSLRNSQKPATA